MTRYLLNSAVIAAGAYGTYTYQSATIDGLRAYISAGDAVSRIGYSETADRIALWTGHQPAISREPSFMQPGDEAFVVRLRYRVADPDRKGQPVPDQDWEIGHLMRIN